MRVLSLFNALQCAPLERERIEALYDKTGKFRKTKNAEERQREIDREVIAAFVEKKLFTDEETIRRLVKTNRTLAQKIVDWLNNVIQRLLGTPEQKFFVDARKTYKKLLDVDRGKRAVGEKPGAVIEKGENVIEKAETVQKKEKTSQGDVKYSVEESFADQIDQVKKAPERFQYTHLYVRETPSLLGKFGLDVSKPMLMTKFHLRDITTAKTSNPKHHGLSKENVLNAVAQMDKPAMIIASQQNDGSLLIVTNEQDSDGLPIMINIFPHGYGLYNEVRVESNFIRSMYGRGIVKNTPTGKEVVQNIGGFVKKAFDDGRLLFVDKKKSQQLQNVPGVYFPDVIMSADFKANIAKYESLVKGADKPKEQFSIEEERNNLLDTGAVEVNDKIKKDRYDYSVPFAQQIDDYKAGKLGEYDTLVIGPTPEVLRRVGFNPLPMTINKTHIDYALNGMKDEDHRFEEEELKKLPEKIKDPVAVIASETQRGTSVVVLLEFQSKGKSVVAPVAIDGFGRQNSIRIDSNAITSLYGKDNAITKLLNGAIQAEQKGKVGVFYINKKKTAALLQRAGLQLPGGLFPDSGLIHSIREKGSPVNPKLEDITYTQQFQRWFGDWQKAPKQASKVVDEKGRPLVVYHQTKETFTIFDPRHKGSGITDNETPFGIFLKPGDEDIGIEGGIQMALYANIRKPLRALNRKDLVEKVKSISPEYARLTEEAKSLDETYQGKLEKAERAEQAEYEKWWQENKDSEGEFIQDAATDQIIEEWGKKGKELAKEMKAVISSALKKAGHDGIILQRDSGSWGRSTKTYIAISSNQVKSATDNVGLFDKNNSDIRYSIEEDSSGKRVVLLTGDSLQKHKSGRVDHKTLRNYLREHIGDVYPIFESGQKVYIGKDLPNEYVYSKSAKRLDTERLNVKAHAATNLDEIVEIATNRQWEKNRKKHHNTAAKYGWYRYDSRIAVPVYDEGGSVVDSSVYDATVLIRNDADGKKYLYDLIGLKKNNSVLVDPSKWQKAISGIQNTIVSTDSIRRESQKVNGKDRQNVKYSIEESIPAIFEEPPKDWDETQVYFSDIEEEPKSKRKLQYTPGILLPKTGNMLPKSSFQYAVDSEEDPLGRFAQRDPDDPTLPRLMPGVRIFDETSIIDFRLFLYQGAETGE